MTETRAVVPAEDGKMSFGQTALRPQDIVIPRVKIVQQMSKEAADKKADPGDFYNTLTGENFGPALVIQPIQTFMQRIFIVRDDKKKEVDKILKAGGRDALPEGDGLMCRSFDMIVGRGDPGGDCETCPLSQWVDRKTPPICTETYNVAAVTDIGDLVVMSFSRSSAKVGKRLFSAIRMTTGAPWTKRYGLTTIGTRNDKGNFFVADFAIASDRPDTGQIRQAIHWAERLAGVTIDVTPTEEEDGTADLPDDVGSEPGEGQAF